MGKLKFIFSYLNHQGSQQPVRTEEEKRKHKEIQLSDRKVKRKVNEHTWASPGGRQTRMSFSIYCWKPNVVQNMCASVGEKFAEVVYWMESEACGFGAWINCRVYPRSATMCVFALAALLQLAGYHSNSAGFIMSSRPEAIQSSFPSLLLNVTMLLDILTINLTNLMRGY